MSRRDRPASYAYRTLLAPPARASLHRWNAWPAVRQLYHSSGMGHLRRIARSIDRLKMETLRKVPRHCRERHQAYAGSPCQRGFSRMNDIRTAMDDNSAHRDCWFRRTLDATDAAANEEMRTDR